MIQYFGDYAVLYDHGQRKLTITCPPETAAHSSRKFIDDKGPVILTITPGVSE